MRGGGGGGGGWGVEEQKIFKGGRGSNPELFHLIFSQKGVEVVEILFSFFSSAPHTFKWNDP